jgi:tRNA A-37 threonylcarbamoyl transferase component Bud32
VPSPLDLTIHRLAPGLDPAAWERELAAIDLEKCDILKRDGASVVVGARIAGREVVIKSAPRRGMIPGLRSWLGLSRDDRQWRGAVLLFKAGVPTARPLALATRGSERQAEGLLVLERLRGPTLLEVLSRGGLSVREEHALAREAGRIAGRIELAGLTNRDAKPSNWIVTSTDATRPGLALIDTVGVHRGRAPEAMLASMIIESIGLGCRPRRSLAMRCLQASLEVIRPVDAPPRWRHQAAVGAWIMIEGVIKRHGDPTPRVNPLRGRETRA